MDRITAAKAGFKRFDGDKPCKRGHVGQRYTSNGACIACHDVSSSMSSAIDRLRKLRAEALEIENNKKNLKNLEIEKRQQSQSACEGFMKMKTLCPNRLVNSLRNFAFTVAAIRDSRVQFRDIALPNLTPRSMGSFVSLYTLACHPEDNISIINHASRLMATVQATPEEIQAAATQRAGRLAAMEDNGDPR